MKTTAAVLYALNRPLIIEELTIPPLGPGQVLVQIAFSGLCRSQLNEILGHRGEDKFLPHLLGHEGSGIVREVGRGVKKVKRGDHVVLTWIKGKGADVPSCRYQNDTQTFINSGAVATFASHAVVAENRVVAVSGKLPLEYAALLGCAIPTGAGLVRHGCKATPGSSIAIFGMGGIGMSALAAARMTGCNPIIAIDIHRQKLAAAKNFGAHTTINASRHDPLEQIWNITNGQGVDFSLETAGVKSAMETAFKAVRPAGGLAVIAGNLAAGQTISLDPFDLIKGKRIMGSWGGGAIPDKDIPWYEEQYYKKALPLEKLVTHRLRLGQINRALSILQTRGNVTRVILSCQS